MYHGKSVTAPGNLFSVRILKDITGGALGSTFYQRPGDGKYFVASAPGPYVIQVTNTSAGRIEVLLGVDGRDVFAEEAADLRQSVGQVLLPGETVDFKGFRISDESVYQFEFGALEGGVAEVATGTSEGSGIIGVAAYRESHPIQRLHDHGDYGGFLKGASVAGAAGPQTFAREPATKGMTMGAERSSVGADMSTHLGEEVSDPVGRTTFARLGDPVVVAIGYASREVLDAAGLTGPAEPKPFPGRGTGYRALKAKAGAGQ